MGKWTGRSRGEVYRDGLYLESKLPRIPHDLGRQCNGFQFGGQSPLKNLEGLKSISGLPLDFWLFDFWESDV